MKFFGIDMQGEIKLEGAVTDGFLTEVYSDNSDRRILYYSDDSGITGKDRLFIGGAQSGRWVEILTDNTEIDGFAELIGAFHPLNGSATEAMAVLELSGDNIVLGGIPAGGTSVRINDPWIKISNGTPVDGATVIKSGIAIEAGAVDDSDDVTLFYDRDRGLQSCWAISGFGYLAQGESIATQNWVSTQISGGGIDLSGYYIKSEVDALVNGLETEVYTNMVINTIEEVTDPLQVYSTIYWTGVDPVSGVAGQGYEFGYSGIAGGIISDNAKTVVKRDTNGDIYARIGYLTASAAQYADLAEKYLCDETLPVGTVVEVGDDNDYEVVPCALELSPTVVGVVSENPAYVMNSKSQGLPIALTGKTPVRVIGPVYKGDFLVAAGGGVARKGEPHEIMYKIGLALETDCDVNEKSVMAIVK